MTDKTASAFGADMVKIVGRATASLEKSSSAGDSRAGTSMTALPGARVAAASAPQASHALSAARVAPHVAHTSPRCVSFTAPAISSTDVAPRRTFSIAASINVRVPCRRANPSTSSSEAPEWMRRLSSVVLRRIS